MSGNDDDEIYLWKLDSCARSLFACDCERVFDKGTSIANRFLANAPVFLSFSEPVDSRRFFVCVRIMNKIRLKTFLVARKMFWKLLLVICWFFIFRPKLKIFFFKIQQAKNTGRKESHKNSECFVTRSWKTSKRCAKAEAENYSRIYFNLITCCHWIGSK